MEEIPKLYYKELLVYNMHSLLHLGDDVKNHGPLDNFGAFDFENYMQILKRKMRSKSLHLSQMIKRVSEMEHFSIRNIYQKRDAQIIDCKIKEGMCFLTKTGRVCVTVVEDNEICIQYFATLTAVKNYPLPSSQLSVYFARDLGIVERLDREVFLKKCVLLPFKNFHYCIPLCNSQF